MGLGQVRPFAGPLNWASFPVSGASGTAGRGGF